MVTNFANGLAVDGFEIPHHAVITVGAEDTNVVAIAVQLYSDAAGTQPLTNAAAVYAYLSDAATGAGVAATAPSGGVAIDTNGLLSEVVANKAGWLISNAAGLADLEVTETSADVFYLVLVLPTGRVVVSSAITFAGP